MLGRGGAGGALLLVFCFCAAARGPNDTTNLARRLLTCHTDIWRALWEGWKFDLGSIYYNT